MLGLVCLTAPTYTSEFITLRPMSNDTQINTNWVKHWYSKIFCGKDVLFDQPQKSGLRTTRNEWVNKIDARILL